MHRYLRWKEMPSFPDPVTFLLFGSPIALQRYLGHKPLENCTGLFFIWTNTSSLEEPENYLEGFDGQSDRRGTTDISGYRSGVVIILHPSLRRTVLLSKASSFLNVNGAPLWNVLEGIYCSDLERERARTCVCFSTKPVIWRSSGARDGTHAQQPPKPHQWQCWILNPLSYQGNPGECISCFSICMKGETKFLGFKVTENGSWVSFLFS